MGLAVSAGGGRGFKERRRRANGAVEHLAQHGVPHRCVRQAVERGNHRQLGRIPGNGSPSTRRQLGELELEAFDELALKAQLDRAGAGERSVVMAARDEDRVHRARPRPPNAGHCEPLLAAELELDPSRRPATRQVSRVTALGDNPLESELGDAGDECLGALRDKACRCAPRRPVEGQLLEQGSALGVRESPDRAPIEVQHVEDLEHRWMPVSP